MALLLKESQNRLRGRAASGDLLAPGDLLRTRCFSVAVAFAMRFPFIALAQSIVPSWTVIIDITRPLPS